MFSTSNQAFQSFVAQARTGKNSVPRILIGTVIIIAVWFAGTFAVLAGGSFLFDSGLLPASWIAGAEDSGGDIFYSRAGMVGLILTLSAIWPGVWIVMRLLHKRRLRTLFGANARIAGGDFWRAAGVTLVVATLLSLIAVFFEPRVFRTDLSVGSWAMLLPFMAILLLFQTSAEEVLFRGYLMQSLAARFRSPIVWAVLPAALFSVAHWSPPATLWMNAMVIVAIFVFAMAAVWLVYRTGNLSAAMGMHFANNLVAFLFVSASEPEQALSIYGTPAIEDPIWTVTDAVLGGITQIAMTAIILALLLWRRSPFRIGQTTADKPDPNGLMSNPV